MHSKRLIESFVNNFILPIHIFERPYFPYLMDLYDKNYNTWYYYDLFYEFLNKTGSEKFFFMTYNAIRNNIINSIKYSKEYEAFNKYVKVDKEDKILRSNIYHSNYDNKIFLSMDLKEANFTCIKYFFSSLVRNCSTYEEFITYYTDLEYLKQSKHFRMIIFSVLTQQKLDVLQNRLLKKAINLVNNYFKEDEIIITSPDEFVIALKDESDYLENSKLQNDINLLEKKLSINFTKNIFTLKQMKPLNCFAKEYYNGKVEFKNVPKIYLPQVYKKYYNMKINDYDLMFYKNSDLTRFEKALKFI